MGALPVELIRAGSMAKVVDSPLLNRLGVQVARAVVAHQIHDRRGVRLRGAATAEQLEAIEEDGIVAIQNFLPKDRFAALKEEAMLVLRDSPKVHKHGPNRVIQRTITDADNVPEMHRFFENPVLLDLFEWGERTPVDLRKGLRAVEELVQGEGEDVDQETALHTDIFFPTHKGWLYLEDVARQNAPFVYVKGSHKMPLDRLAYEYSDSCAGNRKSRRVTEEEFAKRGLVETTFELPANTLVVANVCGYHRRLRGQPGNSRFGVHVSHRRNPFLPVGIDAAALLESARPLRSLLERVTPR